MKVGKQLLIVAAVVLVVALAVLHTTYPLPYVYRVLAYRYPNYCDIHKFPASAIAEPDIPSLLPVDLDRRVATLSKTHPRIENFDAFLVETQTTAFLAVHEGRIIEERYLNGHNQDSVENTFSVAKSITSALVGLAVRDGLISLTAPVTEYLPELVQSDQGLAGVTIDSLLDMRSGIRYDDDVRFPFITSDDSLSYYFPDLKSLLLERTTVASPPGDFQYNKYNTQLLGLVLRRTSGMPVSEYLQSQLWHPLGASQAAGWTTDDHGMERMESGFFATARDLARFGLLYLHRGQVNGQRVLPEAFIMLSTDTPTHIKSDEYNGRQWDYRLGWWIVPRPEGRSDFSAIGHFGQFIYVSPQYDVVFIRNGPDRGKFSDRDWTAFFYYLAERLSSTVPSTDLFDYSRQNTMSRQ